MAIIRENRLKAEESKSGYDGTEQDVDIFLQSDNAPYPGKLPWKESAQAKELSLSAEEPDSEMNPVSDGPVDEEQSRLDAIFGDGDFEGEEDPLFGRKNLLEDEEEVSPNDRRNLIEDEDNEANAQRGNLIEDEEDAKLGDIFKEFDDEHEGDPDKLNADKFANEEDDSFSAHEKFELEEREKLDNRHKVEREDSKSDSAKVKSAAAGASDLDSENGKSNRGEGDFGDSEYATSKIETGEGVRVDISKEDLSELNALRESLKDELSAPAKHEPDSKNPVKQTPFEDVKNDPKAKSVEIPEMERASGEKTPEPFEFIASTADAGEPVEEKYVDGESQDEPKDAKTPQDNEKRKKRKFLWIGVAVAAIVLSVSALGYFYLSDLFTAKPQSELDSNRTFLNAIAEKLGINKETQSADPKKAGKTAKIAHEKEGAKKRLPEKKSNNAASNEQTSNASAPIATVQRKPEEVQQPKPEASKIIIIEKPKALKPAEAAPRPLAKKAPIQRRATPAPKSAYSVATPRRATVPATGQLEPIGGVYTVQVYSTPSREVAEQILNRLLRRSVVGAYISKQNIREVTYYRVRFGKYSSQEQARQAATRAGYPQSWIDRIK